MVEPHGHGSLGHPAVGSTPVDGSDLVISRATPREADALLVTARSTYAGGLQAQRALSQDQAADRAAGDVARLLPQGPATAGHLFLTGRRGGQVLAGIWVAIQGPGAVGQAWIHHLWVEPAARRSGAARTLVLAAAAAAREHGAQQVGLNVFGDNHAAIALYDRLGFAVTEQQMSLPLNNP